LLFVLGGHPANHGQPGRPPRRRRTGAGSV